MTAAVLAIDGGNSKTDVALVSQAGEVLAYVRGPGSSPHRLGIEGSANLLDDLVGKAVARAGIASPAGCAGLAQVYLAGADLPQEVALLRAALEGRRWSRQLVVDNDTLALLRAGTDTPNAVAVVCGAGINCIGVTADGREARFPSLGRISGDWGGGVHLGDEAMWWAARAVDGRSRPTILVEVICSHFGASSLQEVIEALHFGQIPQPRLGELAPAVLAAASQDGDPVALGILEHLAAEVAVLAVTAMRRLDLLDRNDVVLVLGGGVLTGRDPVLHRRIAEHVHAAAPGTSIVVTDVAPVVGAALWGLDALGADPHAEARLRETLRIYSLATKMQNGCPSGSA